MICVLLLVKSGELFMYVDDKTIYCTGGNVDQGMAHLIIALRHVRNFINGAWINPEKCETRSTFVGPIPPVLINDSLVNE